MFKYLRRAWALRRISRRNPDTQDTTEYLLSSPENARRLRAVIAEIELAEAARASSLGEARAQLLASGE